MVAPISVEVVETSSLGDRSYLAADDRVAVVVDPQRDVDRVLAVAGRLGVRIALVLETHVHNDYVSGGLELARLTGAAYGIAAEDDVAFERRPIADGDVLEVSGRMRLRAVATPGHTYHHLSYVLEDGGSPLGVFTGGSLLWGTTGRTDLLGAQHREVLAAAQHASAHRLADMLPAGAAIWPTHGFGSFCSAAPASADASTIGDQFAVNPAFTRTEAQFVEETLAGLDAFPAYYAHMGVRNVAGPEPVDLRPARPVSARELTERLERGEWVVDLRARKAYLSSHLVGSVSLGLDGPMATWLGWLVDWGAPVTLVGADRDQVAEAQRELVRIGIDRPAGAVTGEPEDWVERRALLRSMPSATFDELARARAGHRGALPGPAVVLDVRMGQEWQQGHIDGAHHIPLPELRDRMTELPEGPVWVHCGSGYRAALAASLLEGRGRSVVVIDDEFDHASEAGLDIVSPG